MNNNYVIGVDVGGTKVAYGLFDNEGKIIYKTQHATDFNADGQVFSDILIRNIDAIVTNNGLTYEQLDGVGIGMPSFIKRETGFVFMTSAMPAIKNFAMGEYLEMKIPTRVVLDNDANTAALAEYRHGAGRGTQHMVYIVIGTGFGSGIIIDGKVFSGSYGAAGECGHAIATPGEGIMCGCENKGCYMSYIAGKHIPERVRLGLEKGIKSTLNPETVNGQELLNAYNNGDLLAIEVMHKMADYLAQCLFNIYQMLNIDTFVFGGGVTNLGDALFDRMRDVFNSYYHIEFPVHFKMAELGEDVGIIGAAEYLK